MAGKLLTTQSTLQCPHGGTVTATSTSQRVTAGSGAHVLTIADVFTISGCPFQIPAPSGTVPSPCLTVQWVVSDLRVKVNSTPTFSESSVGLCFSATGIPQGAVTVANTQQKASSQ